MKNFDLLTTVKEKGNLHFTPLKNNNTGTLGSFYPPLKIPWPGIFTPYPTGGEVFLPLVIFTGG